MSSIETRSLARRAVSEPPDDPSETSEQHEHLGEEEGCGADDESPDGDAESETDRASSRPDDEDALLDRLLARLDARRAARPSPQRSASSAQPSPAGGDNRPRSTEHTGRRASDATPELPRGGRDSAPRRDRRHARRQDPETDPEDTDSELEDDESDDDPPTHHSLKASELFKGGALLCPHDLGGNPYPRAHALRAFATHYDPEVAGDTVHAKLYRELKSTANQREMCTLLPTLSYQHDAIVCLADAQRCFPAPRLAPRLAL